MIEDVLSRHYQAENLPAGHPVREAIAELRRLRAERDALLDLVEAMDGYEGAEGWSRRLRKRIDAALTKEPKPC